jgi:predicted regulator of Ras-like GTPase activity (Roadblock/LC7/MglB family)/type II secretory pathway predicted ATPase ExeA
MVATKLSLVKKHTHEVFKSSSYLKVINDFDTNIRKNSGLIILTGDPGTGKTVVAKNVFNKLEAENHRIIRLNPHSTIDEMIDSTYKQVGFVPKEKQRSPDIEKKLKTFFVYLLVQSKEIGLIRFLIDDAHEINTQTFCHLLHLLKWQTGDKKSFQVVLIGLPLLKSLLSSLEIAKLRTEDPINISLQSFNNEDVASFIAQRLNESGIEQDYFFPKETVDEIVFYTMGIPSFVAVLFDSMMAIMNSTGQNKATTEIVYEAVNTFSQTWESDGEYYQLPRQQTEVTISKQTPLFSDMRGKLNKLFSQNKTDNKQSNAGHPIGKIDIADAKQDPKTEMKKIRDQNSKKAQQDTEIRQAEISTSNSKLHIQHKLSGLANIGNIKPNDISEDSLNLEPVENDQKSKIPKEGSKGFKRLLELQNANTKSKSVSRPPIQHNKQVDTMNTMNTMNRGEQLNKALKALQSGSPDVEAVALISEDGLMVASVLPQDLDEIRVGGMSATLLSLGTRSSAELRRGKVEEIIVRGEHGYTVMLNAGRGTLLLVVANQNAKLGLIFFDMHDTIEKIVTIL